MKALVISFSISCFLLVTSCSEDKIVGSGPIVTEELNLNSFESIDVQVAGEITLSQGIEQSVSVISQSNIIRELKMEVINDTWVIAFSDGSFEYDRLDILITLPSFENVHLRGSGNITIEDFKGVTNPGFFVSGSGDISIGRLEGLDAINFRVSGSGSIDFFEESSIANNMDISISGSGSFYGFSIPSRVCDITVAGSGISEVTVQDELNVDISGSGKVYYKGKPSIVSSITGSGMLVDSN